MSKLELQVVDGLPESKADLIEAHLLPGYSFKYTKFAIPANIQGQINCIHSVMMQLNDRLDGDDRKLCSLAGMYLEALEEDLKNYRIEAQELNL